MEDDEQESYETHEEENDCHTLGHTPSGIIGTDDIDHCAHCGKPI